MKTPLLYGVYTTIASAVVTLALHLLGFTTNPEKLFVAMLIGLPLSLLIWVLGIIFGTKAVRAERGPGAFTYGQAFKAGLLVVVFTALFSCIFNFIYYTFLFTDFAEVTIQWTRSFMEKMNAPAAKIEEQIENMRASLTPASQAIKGFFSAVIFGAILSLITSAFLKRAAPENLGSVPPPPPL